MNISHALIIDKLGGITAVANRLAIKPPSVSGWIAEGKNGIPDGRLIELGAEIEKVLPYRRWHLRPDDWFVIWPELIGSAGAPRVPAGNVVNAKGRAGENAHPAARATLHLKRAKREGPSRTSRHGPS